MFDNKKERSEELRLKVIKWWGDLKYFDKLEILLAQGTKADGYPSYNITAIEHIGVRTFWDYRNLEQKALIMEMWEKQKKERR